MKTTELNQTRAPQGAAERKSSTVLTKNFNIMKKQILILVLFVAAIVAGTSKSYGQSLPSTVLPEPLVCTEDYPLHPRPGVPYRYAVENVENYPTNEDSDISYFWWATKNQNFIDTVLASPNYPYADTLNKLEIGVAGELIAAGPSYASWGSDDSISITWSSSILANTSYRGLDGVNTPTFVAMVAQGECTDNIQVFEIDPQPAFTVDIAGIDPNVGTAIPYGDSLEQCVDVVRSAVYNTSTYELNMDYGTDTMYFEVVAANFVNSWIPYFENTGGLTAPQTFDISWYYSLSDAELENNPINGATGLAPGGTANGTSADSIWTNEPNTTDGVSIFVKVVIHNTTFESLATQTFELAVDGIDSSGQWDMVNEDCTEPTAADLDDRSRHVVTPRPDVNDGPGQNVTVDDESTAPNETINKN